MPSINQAQALRIAVLSAAMPNDLAHFKGIQAALLTASGLSDKDSVYLRPTEKATAIQNFINNVLTPAGPNFVEELVNRFMLAHDNALSSSMRDAGDILAQRKLSRALIATLALGGIPYRWRHSSNNSWMPMPDDDSGIELYLSGLSWTKGKRRRTVVYNRTLPFLKNNVDLCLLNCGPDELPNSSRTSNSYLALGELKGGIDPAGADEHWKTAKAALARIQEAFAQNSLIPHTFFIGAAIAKKMAQEIWTQLEEGTLENAANLTAEAQVASISRWLCSL